MLHKVATQTVVNKILKQDRNSYFFALMLWKMLKSFEADEGICEKNHHYISKLLKDHNLDLADGQDTNLKISAAESLWLIMALRKVEFIGERDFTAYFVYIEELFGK
ncbi:hypothetical protein H6758_03140 [Candidatus Nomurabacteria bacterium]|nr:hypothetical protein [Candidatus Nomurabacteria bacterium]